MSNRGKLTFQSNYHQLDDYDYDRRLRKRKARLVAATEDAFDHVRRLNDQKSKSKNLWKSQNKASSDGQQK
jgi:hypothetical protein